MTFAHMGSMRPEFARELPRFVAEVRQVFTPEEIQQHLARIEREDREAAEVAADEIVDDFVEAPEIVAARRERFLVLKELLTSDHLGTS